MSGAAVGHRRGTHNREGFRCATITSVTAINVHILLLQPGAYVLNTPALGSPRSNSLSTRALALKRGLSGGDLCTSSADLAPDRVRSRTRASGAYAEGAADSVYRFGRVWEKRVEARCAAQSKRRLARADQMPISRMRLPDWPIFPYSSVCPTGSPCARCGLRR
jgi:hypothetical protein